MIESSGGDVHIKAGDGGAHGPGGNIEINGGIAGVTIKGGDGGAQSAAPTPITPPIPQTKRWLPRLIESIVVRVIVGLILLAATIYLGLR